ncbi:hypothetical protein GALMADRAFT_138438 [Galerina marginata CBS 339.88]|uniref:Uncharacterized protein n=1 Tax=Galerina marginata (strain CBS 339.88) TaxID=685588 RepID=A0A067TH78_GALM3|nr:hypothetical protein GALMADRAFT_138438 [Galerina marginata CBS 339.88]
MNETKNGQDAEAIYGARPNNAELNDDDISGQPPQQTRQQRRQILGTPPLTGDLKSLRSRDAESASVATDVAHNKRGGSKANQVPQAAQASHPFHIDLNIDSHSYPRDAVGANVKNSALYSDSNRTCSPDERRRSISSVVRQSLNRVPEEMEIPPIEVDGNQQHHKNPLVGSQQNYGSVGYGSAATRNGVELGAGPRYVENLLTNEADSEDEDEDEWILDEELAGEGLYRGNYKRLVVLYTLVPLSTLLAIVLLALLATFAFPSSSPSQFPYPPYLPFPLPEVITSTALWSLSYLVRDFLYATSLTGANLVPLPYHRFPSFIPVLTSIISALLQSASSLFFRQLAIPILLISYYSTEKQGLFWESLRDHQQQNMDIHERHFPTWQDDAFKRVWWVALGWAVAEAVVGIKQGYDGIALYKDVLVDAKKNPLNNAEITRAMEENRAIVEDPAGPSTSNRGTESNTVTPTQNHVVGEHTNSTPTERGWGNRQQAVDANRTLGRDHSSSLSSLASNSTSHYDPLQGSLGERQALLKLPVDPLIVASRPTNESDRWWVENEVERDLEELMALKSREELEEVYGIPVIRIPVFISCLHRINSILSSLGICLLLTAAYMQSTLAYYPPFAGPTPIPPTLGIHPFQPSNRSLALTFPPVLILQTVLGMMHTPWILPRIGIHTFVYLELLASLGLFFGGLGVWEALT